MVQSDSSNQGNFTQEKHHTRWNNPRLTKRKHVFEALSDTQERWSGRRESNPRCKLGKLKFYH